MTNVSPLTKRYQLVFTPHDAASTSASEMHYEVWTLTGAAGELLVSGTCTNNVQVSTTVLDSSLVAGTTVSRFLRTEDGAGNWTETSFSVTVDEMPSAPDADVLAALAGSSGVVTMRHLYEQRTAAFAFINDLTTAVQSCSIVCDNNRDVPMSATFVFDDHNLPDTFKGDGSDYVAVGSSLVVNGVEQSFIVGLFRIMITDIEYMPEIEVNVASTHPQGAHATWNGTGADNTSVLLSARIDAPYTVTVGTAVRGAVATIIESEGLVQELALDGEVNVTAIAYTWNPGTTKLQIVNDLLNGINWFPLWCTPKGRLTSRLRLLPELETVAVGYAVNREPRMIVPSFRRAIQQGNIYNRVSVNISDPRRTPAYAAVENVDPSSKSSTRNAILSKKDVDGMFVPSVAKAGELAERLIREEAAKTEIATLNTQFDPRRQPHEVYQIEIDGVERRSHWRALDWQVTLGTGAIQVHRIARAQPLATVRLDP